MESDLKLSLTLLREACLKAASAYSSCYPRAYDAVKRSPLDGHCSAVATMVQGMFGGDIVTGLVQESRHFWNRLPDGTEVDLTSCQFGGDGFTPFMKGRKVTRKDELIHPMFLAFAMMVQEQLAKGD